MENKYKKIIAKFAAIVSIIAVFTVGSVVYANDNGTQNDSERAEALNATSEAFDENAKNRQDGTEGQGEGTVPKAETHQISTDDQKKKTSVKAVPSNSHHGANTSTGGMKKGSYGKEYPAATNQGDMPEEDKFNMYNHALSSAE
jgi:hypothetical protein